MSQLPCTIFRDAISIEPSGREIIDSPLIDIFDLDDIKCANPQMIYAEAAITGAEIIARTIKGSPCGFSKNLGKGSVIHLGTWLGFDTEGHKRVYEEILHKSGAKLRNASADNENITVRERFTNENSAILFIANYFNEEQSGKVWYTHPESGESIAIPYSQQEISWPALYGVLTPVCLEISEGLKILHCTSDILRVVEHDEHLEITLYGERDLAGEIVFEGLNVERIRSAAICGEPVLITHDAKRLAFIYSHPHKKEFEISIKFN
jgi:hypothetical protein